VGVRISLGASNGLQEQAFFPTPAGVDSTPMPVTTP
jgi:hypothetical protein